MNGNPQRRAFRDDIHGIVVVDKPPEITSFGAVKAVRNIFGVKKAGHTGTLDPFATGVLPVCLNKATKIAGLVSGLTKEYRTVMRLGQSSDTFDRTGQVKDHGVKDFPTREKIEEAISRFKGTIVQTPPLFSAIKVDGKPLYKRARQGGTYDMEKKARRVTVERFDILSYEPPLLTVYIRASKGTYVRSLAQDLGGVLGTGALLSELVRTRVGPYRVEDAWSLEKLRDLVAQGRGEEALRGPEEVFDSLPEFPISRADFLELSQGRTRPVEAVETAARTGEGAGLPRGGFIRLADRGGRGFVVAECAQGEGEGGAAWILKPFRAYKGGAALL